MTLLDVVFITGVFLSILASLGVVGVRNPIHSAVCLFVLLGVISIHFFLLGASFLGIIQLLLYAGAVIVLYVFVIMLVRPDRDVDAVPAARPARWGALLVSAGLGAVLLLVIFRAESLRTVPPLGGSPPGNYGSVEGLGEEIFRYHTLPFELTSILIIVGITGAIFLTRRRAGGGTHQDHGAGAGEGGPTA